MCASGPKRDAVLAVRDARRWPARRERTRGRSRGCRRSGARPRARSARWPPSWPPRMAPRSPRARPPRAAWPPTTDARPPALGALFAVAGAPH